MKRGTPDHPKMHELAERLGIPRLYAVGIMEALWHWVAKYAPCGDVGKYKNSFIAAHIGWQGDSDQLINALVDAKWLDRDRTYRLLVHDWRDHADNSVKMYLQRNNLTFIEKTAKTVATKCKQRINNVNTISTLPLPLPLPSLANPLPPVENRENAPKPQNQIQKPKRLLREKDFREIVEAKTLTQKKETAFAYGAEQVAQLERDVSDEQLPYAARKLAQELLNRCRKPPGQQIALCAAQGAMR